MKDQKGISLIKILFLVIIIIGVVVICNNDKSNVKMKWGEFIPPEFYELQIASLNSELYGSETGTLSFSSFNTLGKDVKKAKGKWFKHSNVNFRAKSETIGKFEVVSLTDGENIATFTYDTECCGLHGR